MLISRGKTKSSSSLRTGGRVSLTLAGAMLPGRGMVSSLVRGIEDLFIAALMWLFVSRVITH